jgi:hypothetical protein
MRDGCEVDRDWEVVALVFKPKAFTEVSQSSVAHLGLASWSTWMSTHSFLTLIDDCINAIVFNNLIWLDHPP